MALVIKQTINYPSEIKREFSRLDRDNFSYQGYQALLDYLEEVGDGETELDIIAVCCDFTEDSIDDFIREYNIEIMSKEEWLDDRELFDDEYEEYKIETIREYADYNLGWYQLLNDDTSIIYVG